MTLGGVILGVTLITFTISRLIPGDPVAIMMGEAYRADPAVVAHIREQLGLDQPLPLQYLKYLSQLIQGNWGISYHSNRLVLTDIQQYFMATFELTFVALLLSILVGVPLGIVSALKKDKWSDHLTRIVALGGVAIPIFWLALMMQLVFYSWSGFLPYGGIADDSLLYEYPVHTITGSYLLDTFLTGNWPVFKSVIVHMVMPAWALAFRAVAGIMRMTRATMLETLQQDYVRTAKAWGLSERVILFKYTLRNSLIAVITVIGLTYGQLLQGSWLCESIFNWPGMGLYAVKSILFSDYPAILAVSLVAALAYVIINLVIDILYSYVDPRIRY
jgi:peptide/nickel transport system permease protein